MKIYQLSKLILLVLFSLLLMIPAMAQEVAEDDPEVGVEMTFSGYISFDADGNVYIDGYFLAPSGVISPSLLAEGQYVEVTGIFLNDDTFKLADINTDVEDPAACDSTGATEDTADDCVVEEPTNEEPVCDSTGATEDTADDCVIDEEPACDSTGATEDTADDCVIDEDSCDHPVANRIADAFDIDPCDVEAQHDDGNGFGNIARAYLLAEAYNQALLDGLADGEVLDPALLLDAQAYLDMHGSGTGWGQIMKESGVHPSDLAPGKLKKRADSDDDGDDAATTTEATTSNGNGKGNGNANANSNKGNGNGKGNNGNNGNGNSNKDKGKDKGKGKGKGK